MERDIFRCGVTWPREVILWGTGPNGIPCYRDLPGRYVVAMNKAMLFAKRFNEESDGPGIHPAFWICSTSYYKRYEAEWWEEAVAYAREIGTQVAFMWHLAEESAPADYDYTYYHNPDSFPPASAQHSLFHPGEVHGGGTIAGIGVDLARQLAQPRPSRCILVGVDMSSGPTSTYADGTMGRHAPNTKWDELACLQHIVDQAQSEIEVLSWSKTALKLEEYIR